MKIIIFNGLLREVLRCALIKGEERNNVQNKLLRNLNFDLDFG